MKPYILVPKMTHAERIRWRLGGLGGSDADAIMGRSPWTTPEALWRRRTGREAWPPSNAAMQRGIELEPLAREEYQQMTGLAMPEACAFRTENSLFRASLDGLNEANRRVLEIKCPGQIDHAIALKGLIPTHYHFQCVHYLMVMGFDELDYFSFDGIRGKIIRFERDEKRETELRRAELAFWAAIQNDTPPIEVEAPRAAGGIFKMRRFR